MPLIKRYANRKLYDTDSKRYVTLEDVAEAIRQGEDVKVVDHSTGEDLTSITLMQVIFEEEKKIGGLMPQVFLSRLIRTGGSTMNALRSRLAAFDPFQVVDEEIKKRVQSLVERGMLTEQEGLRMVDLLVRKPSQADVIRIPVQGEPGEKETEQPVAEPEVQVEEVDPAEVEALARQVEMLEQELERLKQTRSGGQEAAGI